MDICIASGAYPPLEGGPSSLSFELSRKLVTLGNKVTIVTFHPKFRLTYENDNDLSILRLPQLKLGNERSFNPLRFLFKLIFFILGLFILKPVKRFKLIHAMDHSLAGIPSAIFSFFTRIPLFVRFPADWLFHVVNERGWDKASVKSQSVDILQRIILKMIKQVIVTNQYVLNLLTSYGVPKEKIVIIPNAVDINRFHPPPNKEIMKQKMGFTKNQTLILSVCRLHPSKRLDDLIITFGEIRKSLKISIHLLIAGSGPDLVRLMKISKSTGFSSNISFLGRISNEKIHELYQTADLFVLASVHETFGIVVLEAMASGIPTILARSGGIVSNFTNNKDCIMYDPGNLADLKNVLYEVITNDKMRKLNVDSARRMVINNYSWDSIIKQTIALYESSINEKSPKNNKPNQGL